jgi:hypothetical protein
MTVADAAGECFAAFFNSGKKAYIVVDCIQKKFAPIIQNLQFFVSPA